MKRFLAVVLVFSFILWVLPLGVFIKPSDEKLACDGQRAMCMCHVMMRQSPDKAMEAGIVLKEGSSASKENSPAGGNYFVSARRIIVPSIQSAVFLRNQYLCYKNPYLALLEYVPKM